MKRDGRIIPFPTILAQIVTETDLLVFLVHATNRWVRHKAFLRKFERRAVAQTRSAFQKMPRPYQPSPIKRRFRRQAINLTPPERVRVWGTSPWGSRSERDMDGGFPLPMSGALNWQDEPCEQATQTDPCKEKHGRQVTRFTSQKLSRLWSEIGSANPFPGIRVCVWRCMCMCVTAHIWIRFFFVYI